MPLRWTIAGRVGAALPDVRGRDRLTGWLRGRSGYVGPISGRFAVGELRFALPDCADAAVRAFADLRYRPPALYPVLAAALGPGACFYDVGANVGIYALAAASLVGPSGDVHAFEPVPQTASVLSALADQNRLGWVHLRQCALGEREGEVTIDLVEGASERAHVGPGERGGGPGGGVTVPMTTLDGYWAGGWAPDLIKIDVEGHEVDVLRGGTALLRAARPAIVAEVVPDRLARVGSTPADVGEALSACGYELYDLTRRGVRLIGAHDIDGTAATNLLALVPCDPRHRAILGRLARARFPRNKTT